MKLTDLMDKHQQVQLAIFHKILISKHSVSIKTLENEMDVSFPTLQKEIRALQSALSLFQPGAELIRLEDDSLTLELGNQFPVKKFIYSYLEQALDYQILCFIFQNKEVSITKMAMHLQVSEASIFRRLKSINELLNEYDIQFRNKKIVGEEKQIRVFFYHFFETSLPFEVLQKQFKNSTIRHLIQVMEKQLHLKFTNQRYWQLALWLGIMQKRLDYRGEQRLYFEKKTIQLIEQDTFYQELKNILARYLSRFAFPWSEEEAVFFYLFFLSEGFVLLTDTWLEDSPIVSELVNVNQQIYETIVGTTDDLESFQAFLLERHIKLAYFKGWIDTQENDLLLLSDQYPEKMSTCMTIVESSLSKKVSDSQWHMLDQAYGLVLDVYQRRQQKELYVGVALDNSLQSEEIYQFLHQHLAGIPNVTIKRAKKREYSLLVASEFTDITQFSFQELFLLSGQLSMFEINRLKNAIQQLLD
ncbi:helix-turn-helix domain-containing protein [Candidatus Enterococcus willemsii]|uniref:Mga helix-turn-helix domain-containing protein n=1 Tax=Candidatus Enterococcus willemsii TaxID=1857215 RepID=A0ABQ6Z2N4_9ENTE|nr:helix-turn-helix domain-containing protein [Enterococcus sp. CU12B]KAF1306001.1 hypothetical protein BAU17_03280 [Enterococcus sp. CU12B]